MLIKQSETLSFNLAFFDNKNIPQAIINEAGETKYYLHSTMTDGTTTHSLNLKLTKKQTKTIGTGINQKTVIGVFEVVFYLSAAVTKTIPAGEYDLVVRSANTATPADSDLVEVMYEDKVTVEAIIDATGTGTFIHTTPEEADDGQ